MSTPLPSLAPLQPVTVILLGDQAPAWSPAQGIEVIRLDSLERCLDQLAGRGATVVVVDGALLPEPDPSWVDSVEALLGPVMVVTEEPDEIKAAHASGVGTVLPPSFYSSPSDLAVSLLTQHAGEAGPSADDLDRYMRDAIHEFRTPLTTLTEFASLMQDGIAGELSERQETYVAYMLSGCKRMAEMFDDYRDGLRLRLGSLEPRTRWVCMSRLLEQATCSAPWAPGLTLEVHPEVSQALVDESLLSASVARLFDSAKKFGGRETPLAIRALPSADGLTVSISYEGPAPAADDARLMAEGLMKHNGYYRSVARVFGLGVAMADRYLRCCGGRLDLAAGADSGGVFSISLPAEVSELIQDDWS